MTLVPSVWHDSTLVPWVWHDISILGLAWEGVDLQWCRLCVTKKLIGLLWIVNLGGWPQWLQEARDMRGVLCSFKQTTPLLTLSISRINMLHKWVVPHFTCIIGVIKRQKTHETWKMLLCQGSNWACPWIRWLMCLSFWLKPSGPLGHPCHRWCNCDWLEAPIAYRAGRSLII